MIPASRAANADLPAFIGRYEVLLPIASGGMATVYLARSRGAGGFERDVALKLTHAHLLESPESGADLVEEAKLAVRIRHPNVVPIIDVGEDASGVFLVMDYVEGDTLSGLTRRAEATGAPLPPEVGLRMLCDALFGLHAAHELRDDAGEPLALVHRDFSPQNILVGLDGTGRLTDFGIAKAASRIGHTRTGNVKGKIAYMAPEQARGLELDRRADIWAGGVMAWELLAGRRLYPAHADEVATLMQLVNDAPPLLRDVNPDVHPALEGIVAEALMPDVERRTTTALELGRGIASACRAAGLALPEHADVGEIVERLVGPKLAKRRARVKEILGLRARAGSVAPPPQDAFAQTPIPGATPSWPSGEAARSAVGARLSTGGALKASTAEVEHTSTDTTSASDPAGQRLAAPGRDRDRGAKLVGAGALVVAAASLGVCSLATRSPRENTSVVAVTTPTADAPPSPSPSPSPSPPAVTAAAPVAPKEPSPVRVVKVRSDAQLASLRVDGHSVDVAPGVREIPVDAKDGEALALEAKSVDGRRTTAVVSSTASAAGLTFPPRSVHAPAAPPSPLVASPYKKTK